MEREIVVEGWGEVAVAPDEALVHVTVSAEGSTSDEAFLAAVRGAADVDAVIERRRDGIERNLTTSLTVVPRARWRKGESVRTGWQASRRSVIPRAGRS